MRAALAIGVCAVAVATGRHAGARRPPRRHRRRAPVLRLRAALRQLRSPNSHVPESNRRLRSRSAELPSGGPTLTQISDGEMNNTAEHRSAWIRQRRQHISHRGRRRCSTPRRRRPRRTTRSCAMPQRAQFATLSSSSTPSRSRLRRRTSTSARRRPGTARSASRFRTATSSPWCCSSTPAARSIPRMPRRSRWRRTRRSSPAAI